MSTTDESAEGQPPHRGPRPLRRRGRTTMPRRLASAGYVGDFEDGPVAEGRGAPPPSTPPPPGPTTVAGPPGAPVPAPRGPLARRLGAARGPATFPGVAGGPPAVPPPGPAGPPPNGEGAHGPPASAPPREPPPPPAAPPPALLTPPDYPEPLPPEQRRGRRSRRAGSSETATHPATGQPGLFTSRAGILAVALLLALGFLGLVYLTRDQGTSTTTSATTATEPEATTEVTDTGPTSTEAVPTSGPAGPRANTPCDDAQEGDTAYTGTGQEITCLVVEGAQVWVWTPPAVGQPCEAREVGTVAYPGEPGQLVCRADGGSFTWQPSS